MRSDSNRDRNARRSRENSAREKEIGPLPEIVDPSRRQAALGSLKLFLETYFPNTFTLDFAEFHDEAIADIERSAISGGLDTIAMPRGSGKTSIVEGAAIWGMFRGVRNFLQIIGATATAAKDILRSIKVEIETNELLLEDFPEICYPVACLEGINNRAAGQTLSGERTRITWRDDKIILPSVPGSAASGSIIRTAGITGAVRGAKHKTIDGATLRPDWVLVDDFQTLKSAASAGQTERRLRIINQDVLGLAGPDKQIAGTISCTVIFPGDGADQLLDTQKNARFNGKRTKLLKSFPTNMELWENYGRVRDDGFRSQDGGKAAREFYAANRAEMDKGAEVSWQQRHNPNQLSAIQYAMDLYLDDSEGFAAEYQNEPQQASDTVDLLKADEITERLNHLPPGISPTAAKRITCFIDVQGKVLYYCLVAWSDEFTGAVIDYGAWPKPPREYYTLREIKYSLASKFKTKHLETLIHKGLTAITKWLLDEREYVREDGSPIRIEKVLIDANWETDVVKQWIYRNSRKGLIEPAHGRFVGPDNKPFTEYREEKGEIVGHNWRKPKADKKGTPRHILFDSNAWKTFVHKRLATAALDTGSLTFWGVSPRTHRMIADHLLAEKPNRIKGRDRECTIWKLPDSKPDNHLLDCVSGCCVGESILGGRIEVATPATKRKKARRKRRASTLKC